MFMDQAQRPVHAQFSLNHLALILSVALVLSAFLLVTSPSSFPPVTDAFSLNWDTTTFYDDVYAQVEEVKATPTVVAPEQGEVAGVQIVLLRGPVELRGQP